MGPDLEHSVRTGGRLQLTLAANRSVRARRATDLARHPQRVRPLPAVWVPASLIRTGPRFVRHPELGPLATNLFYLGSSILNAEWVQIWSIACGQAGACS